MSGKLIELTTKWHTAKKKISRTCKFMMMKANKHLVLNLLEFIFNVPMLYGLPFFAFWLPNPCTMWPLTGNWFEMSTRQRFPHVHVHYITDRTLQTCKKKWRREKVFTKCFKINDSQILFPHCFSAGEA